MTLTEARCAFTECLAPLIDYALSQGYQIAFDQGMVPAEGSVHMPGSLHEVGLAQDVVLYHAGIYLTDTPDYKFLGEWWEALGVEKGLPLAWGGRFTRPDGDHFSLAWKGKK